MIANPSLRACVILFVLILNWSIRFWVDFQLGATFFETPETEFLEFGKEFQVRSEYESINVGDPHEVACFSVWACSTGQQEQLLELNPVEEVMPTINAATKADIARMRADLSLVRGTDIRLRFHGVSFRINESYWYYFLIVPNEELAAKSPWLCVVRSKSNGICTLRRVAMNHSDNPMPQGLVTRMPKELARQR